MFFTLIITGVCLLRGQYKTGNCFFCDQDHYDSLAIFLLVSHGNEKSTNFDIFQDEISSLCAITFMMTACMSEGNIKEQLYLLYINSREVPSGHPLNNYPDKDCDDPLILSL